MTTSLDLTHRRDGLPFLIVVVCTGNLCRSPIAEQILRARFLQAGVAITVGSAGTIAMPSDRMPAEAEEVSREFGGVPAGHVPRLLTKQIILDSDLVLTATREHRGAVVSLHPLAARYAFTLNQFARLSEARLEKDSLESPAKHFDTAVAALRDHVSGVASLRGYVVNPAIETDDDIDDPFGQPHDVYDRAGAEIVAALDPISHGIFRAVSGIAQ